MLVKTDNTVKEIMSMRSKADTYLAREMEYIHFGDESCLVRQNKFQEIHKRRP